MSLVTRGLGSGLLVTRGLGTPYTHPYIVGDIILRVDRMRPGTLAIDTVLPGNLVVERNRSPEFRAARVIGWTLRINRENSEQLKIEK